MNEKPKNMGLVALGSLLALYVGVYLVLSLGGRYEPGLIGPSGVKDYAWAPQGFYVEPRWQRSPMICFLPLYFIDCRWWHTSEDAHSGMYPIHEVDPDDIWKYFEAPEALGQSDGEVTGS